MQEEIFIKKTGFTMAEVLITILIIGVVASMTMPALINHYVEKENAVRVKRFVAVLNQAVMRFKAENECYGSISSCIVGGVDSSCSNFVQIGKYMQIVDSVKRTQNFAEKYWLPDVTYNYYGEEVSGRYGGPSKVAIGDCAYLLNDGTTFAIDINPTSFNIIFDVNGTKQPNRVGRDIFVVYVGNQWGTTSAANSYNNDIVPYSGVELSSAIAYKGLCPNSKKCNPNNLDPSKDNGASITAYTLLHDKVPPYYNK